MNSFSSSAWTVPFIFFLIGYLSIGYCYHSPAIRMPSITGRTIQDALTILADHHLSAQIIEQREDIDIMPGIILQQTPAAHHSIKPLQTTYLVVSERPAIPSIPTFTRLSIDEIQKIVPTETINIHKYYLPSNAPDHMCIAQIPNEHTPQETENIVLYFAGQSEHQVIMPQLINQPLKEVQEFLTLFKLTPEISYSKNLRSDTQCITNQKPLAGSIISLVTPLTIQLSV